MMSPAWLHDCGLISRVTLQPVQDIDYMLAYQGLGDQRRRMCMIALGMPSVVQGTIALTASCNRST